MSTLTVVNNPEPEIEVVDGNPLTSSKNVAEVFGKRHDDVLRSIRNLECSKEFTDRNFTATSVADSSGKSNPTFLMTFDGFTFLAMGFTGQKAAQFKEQYIKKFNEYRQQVIHPIVSAPAPAKMSRREILMLALKTEEELEVHPEYLQPV